MEAIEVLTGRVSPAQLVEPGPSAGQLEQILMAANRAPLIVIVAAAVTENPKVPDIEQIVAAGAAAQNMLLAAHALGLGGFWRTGAIAYDAEVKSALGLAHSDTVVGIIYLGSIGVPGQAKPADLAAVTRRW